MKCQLVCNFWYNFAVPMAMRPLDKLDQAKFEPYLRISTLFKPRDYDQGKIAQFKSTKEALLDVIMPLGKIDSDMSMLVRTCISDELKARVQNGKLVGKTLLKNKNKFDKTVKSVHKRIMKAAPRQLKFATLAPVKIWHDKAIMFRRLKC